MILVLFIISFVARQSTAFRTHVLRSGFIRPTRIQENLRAGIETGSSSLPKDVTHEDVDNAIDRFISPLGGLDNPDSLNTIYDIIQSDRFSRYPGNGVTFPALSKFIEVYLDEEEDEFQRQLYLSW